MYIIRDKLGDLDHLGSKIPNSTIQYYTIMFKFILRTLITVSYI